MVLSINSTQIKSSAQADFVLSTETETSPGIQAFKHVKLMAKAAAVAIVVAFATLLPTSPSYAEKMCGERAKILETLAQKHKETPQSIGIAQDGGFVEVLVSPQGGWTILVTYPKRPTCVVAAGQDWASRVIKVGEPI